MRKGKKKSLVGWMVGDWFYWFKYYQTKDMSFATINIPIVFKSKFDGMTDKKVKVRITIEEINE